MTVLLCMFKRDQNVEMNVKVLDLLYNHINSKDDCNAIYFARLNFFPSKCLFRAEGNFGTVVHVQSRCQEIILKKMYLYPRLLEIHLSSFRRKVRVAG